MSTLRSFWETAHTIGSQREVHGQSDADGYANLKRAGDCLACGRTVAEHDKDGKCLFGPGTFKDGRGTAFFWQSANFPGDKSWRFEVKHTGKLVYVHTDGSKRTTTLQKLFDLIGEAEP